MGRKYLLLRGMGSGEYREERDCSPQRGGIKENPLNRWRQRRDQEKLRPRGRGTPSGRIASMPLSSPTWRWLNLWIRQGRLYGATDAILFEKRMRRIQTFGG